MTPVRRLLAATLACALAVCLGLVSAAPAHADQWDQHRWDALVATNKARADNGLAPLRLSAPLNSVAQACAVEVVKYLDRTGSLAHCDGTITTIAPYHERMPSGWSRVAENISATTAPNPTGTSSVAQLMGSTGHRANILTPQFNYLGVGVAKSPTSNWVVFVHNYGAYASSEGLTPLVGSPGSGAMGDHTGDGIADLLAVDGAGDLLLYRGSTSSGAQLVGRIGTGWGGMTHISQIPDISGDRHSDLLARRGGDDSLWLYRGDGAGGLSAWRQAGRNWGGMDQIVPVQNLAGGSTQYVVARRASDGALFRYTLTPNGLADIKHIGTNWNGMRLVIGIGDTTGDGRADVLAIRADGTLWSYAGTATGGIGSARQVGRGWDGFVRAFSPGDLSGDGRPDLVGQRGDGNVFAYANRLGSWSSARQVMSGAQGLRLMA